MAHRHHLRFSKVPHAPEIGHGAGKEVERVPVAAVDKEVYSSEMDFKGIFSPGATTAVVFRFIHYTPSP